MGKYIKLFNNHNEYQQFLGQPSCDGTYSIELPNVSMCGQENEVHYNPSTVGFTGYKTNLMTEQEVIAYVKTYINRPHEDLVNEYTNLYPEYLQYIGEGENGEYWINCWNDVVKYFPCALDDDAQCETIQIGNEAGAHYEEPYGSNAPYWYISWGGFLSNYYPNTGYVRMYFYDD